MSRKKNLNAALKRNEVTLHKWAQTAANEATLHSPLVLLLFSKSPQKQDLRVLLTQLPGCATVWAGLYMLWTNMSHKDKLLRACAWNRCTLLMPTSAQHVQVGPVSKDGSTQLSWLTDLKWVFHFTCHPQILPWLQGPVSSAPSPLYFSDLISLTLLYRFTPAWWAPGYFSSPPGLLLPSSPALVFSSSTCVAPPGILLTLSLTASKALLKCHPLNKPTLVTF